VPQEAFSISLNQNETWHMDKLHFHEDVELLLSLSDGGDFFIGQDMYPIQKNMLFLLDSAVLHRTVHERTDQPYRRHIMHILPSTLERLSTAQTDFARSFRGAQTCTVLSDQQQRELTELFKRLEGVPESNRFGGDIRRNILLLELLLKICDVWQSSEVESGIVNPDYERVLPVLQYIQEHFTETFTLDDLARQFSISKYHLCHIFKNVTGFSVMEYVIQRRIILARELLRQPITVQEAGERAGFQTNSHFIRTFSAYTGVSPKRYARQYRQGAQVAPLSEKR
jgi:AraC-like DNA-binding protein